MTSELPTELTVFAWSTILLFVLIMLQGGTVLREQGFAFNAGPRDGDRPLGPYAGRARRTLENFKETYPVFIGLALALTATGRTGGLAETGAWTWLFARIAFVPLYLFGVPWLRSLAWLISMSGLALMLWRLV